MNFVKFLAEYASDEAALGLLEAHLIPFLSINDETNLGMVCHSFKEKILRGQHRISWEAPLSTKMRYQLWGCDCGAEVFQVQPLRFLITGTSIGKIRVVFKLVNHVYDERCNSRIAGMCKPLREFPKPTEFEVEIYCNQGMLFQTQDQYDNCGCRKTNGCRDCRGYDVEGLVDYNSDDNEEEEDGDDKWDQDNQVKKANLKIAVTAILMCAKRIAEQDGPSVVGCARPQRRQRRRSPSREFRQPTDRHPRVPPGATEGAARMTAPVIYSKAALSDATDVVARFATIGRVDRDYDVLLPGAVTRKAVPISQWNHSSWQGRLPIGRGYVAEEEEALVLRGRIFGEPRVARDTAQALRGLGKLGQWSFGFDVLKSHRGTYEGKPVRFLEQLDVMEVSPVLVASGRDTSTLHLGAKSVRGAEVKTMSGGTPQHPVQLMEVVEMSTESLPADSLHAVRHALDVALDDLGFTGEDVGVRCFLPPRDMPGAATVAIPVVNDFSVEQLAGFAPRTGSDVWVRADLSPRESAVTIGHELRHLWQRANGTEDTERDAEDFGEGIADRLSV